MSFLQAGAAKVALDPPLGIPMFGYGAREGVARAVRDRLHARALYLRGRSEFLLVEVDLCLLSADQANALRARIAKRTEVSAERILLGCVHTHSGPEPGFVAWLGGAPEPSHAEPLWQRVEEAAVRACASAFPARLGVGRGTLRIGRNRRRAGGPVDDTLWVIRVDDADGAPRAVLYLHGCHPTVLGHENLAYSADWPGVASARVEARLPGAVVLFALSAHGDIDPRTRGLFDLAVPGQSRGAAFEALEAIGREAGEAVVAVASELTTHADVEIAAGSRRLRLPVHGADAADAAHAAHLAAGRAEALAALDLPGDAEIGTGELFGLLHERTRDFPLDEARERIARVRRYLRDRTAPRFAGGRRPMVEVQALRVSELCLLGLPAEPTVDVGFDWARRFGGRPAALVSIANGWLRYLPHPSNFTEPGAHAAYEVLMSTLVPDAATRLLDAGEELHANLATGTA